MFNEHNCPICGSENPRMILERPIHDSVVYGPYVFEDVHRDKLVDILWPMDSKSLYFQQDGATCQTSGKSSRYMT